MKHLFILCLCTLLLTACSQKTPDSITGGTAKATTVPTSIPTIEAPQTKLTVFYPDENLESFLQAEVLFASLDENTILHELIHAVPLDHEITVKSFSVIGTELRLDLSREFEEMILSLGTSGERMVIGSIVNTYLTAYGANTMVLTVEGEPLNSGHIVYDFPMEFFQ
ncbi:MAG: GerMN domain-containing protein [Oscillospiraceae bacterium]|nr:GerMN domain-containing protein [Oscillospiraceae bacterium]